MKIQLIYGEFNAKDAVEIITQMIHVKIKYHENCIEKNHNEEDIKLREKKIKNLQKELFDFRNQIVSPEMLFKINAEIGIN